MWEQKYMHKIIIFIKIVLYTSWKYIVRYGKNCIALHIFILKTRSRWLRISWIDTLNNSHTDTSSRYLTWHIQLTTLHKVVHRYKVTPVIKKYEYAKQRKTLHRTSNCIFDSYTVVHKTGFMGLVSYHAVSSRLTREISSRVMSRSNT